MKSISKFVLVLAAAGSCAVAVAQSDSADQDRRMRNRDEAIANWERTQPRDSMASHNDMQPHKTMNERGHEAAQKTRAFTHRQAEKMRRFGERQNARHPAPDPAVVEKNKAPTAMGK